MTRPLEVPKAAVQALQAEGSRIERRRAEVAAIFTGMATSGPGNVATSDTESMGGLKRSR